MRIKHCIKKIFYNIIPLKTYLKLYYQYVFRKRLNLNEPQTFSEKIYWLKLYYAQYQKNLIQKCYDKFTVRNYVKQKIGEHYLNEIYGIYDDALKIDFSKLPDQFALKITQSSGKNIICVNKSKLNIEATIKCLDSWLKESTSCKYETEEQYMYNGKAQIICEKLLKLDNGKIPDDFRVYCFNGEPHYIVYDVGTTLANGQHGDDIRRNVYDLDWNLLDVEIGRKNDKTSIIPRPSNLEEMLEVSRKLSKDFPFVRVDLYNLEGRIIFGELTWIPMGGNCVIKPDHFNYEMGQLLKLPNVKVCYDKKKQK